MFLSFNIEDFMLPCLNKKFFGIDCPGCGIQRAIILLFKGDFAAAYQIYPAIYSLLVLCIFIILNKKYHFKYGLKIIAILAGVNLLIITISYLLKMNFIFNI